jgi:AcrR family transcriptional regulator
VEQLRKRAPRQIQIDQTREWIFQTLMLLMGTHAFSEITVSMLADRSGVTRQTIHRHFVCKEDILLWFMDHAFADFFSRIKKNPDPGSRRTILANSRLALSLCRDNANFLELLIDHGLGHLFAVKIEEFVHLVTTDLLKRKTAEARESCVRTDTGFYREKYFAGGFYFLTVSWIKRGMVDPEEELCRVLGDLVIL